MFGAISDSASDGWRHMLMRRMERRRAEREKQTQRTLQEIDYLLMVDDEARQKASVRDKDGHVAIAKFPRQDGEYNTVAWKAAAFTLAQKAGITVPAVRIEAIGKQLVLLPLRFERDDANRIPFLPVMIMLGPLATTRRSAIWRLWTRTASTGPRRRLRWRRCGGGCNQHADLETDERLRNHGFLWAATGVAAVAGLRYELGADRYKAARSQHGDK
jgi:hypothetical protein